MPLIKGLTQVSFCPGDFAGLRTSGGLVFQGTLAQGVPIDDMDAHLYAKLTNEDAFRGNGFCAVSELRYRDPEKRLDPRLIEKNNGVTALLQGTGSNYATHSNR